jgi:ATP-binding cassette, subfamily C (CFTR/MRP), member 1
MTGHEGHEPHDEDRDILPDPVATTCEQPTYDEPLDEETEIATNNLKEPEDETEEASDSDGKARAQRPDLDRTKSAATDATATTVAPSLPEPKPWYKQPNPLRWGSIPPVPEERVPCPEHKAGFFSSLTFHWIAKMMTVCSSAATQYVATR